MSRCLAVLAAVVLAPFAAAEPVTKPFEYRHGTVALEGTLAYDTVGPAKRAGVLVACEGAANGPVARQRALHYARLGYVALAVDLHGKGVAPKDGKDAAARLELDGKDRSLVRARTEAAHQVFAKLPQVDPKRIAAVGYGVGGTALLELARTGADLEGVAVFHSDLKSTSPADAKKISASILVLAGSDDPNLTLAQLGAFEDEMRSGGVDWQVLRFGGVVGEFTNHAAGRNLKSGAAFDADADERAHIAVKAFLIDAFTPSTPPNAATPRPEPKPPAMALKGVPQKALDVLKHVDQHGEAMANYEGGRTFGNFERVLRQSDGTGRRIRYREWDVNPLKPGVNRGAERLVTGSDGSAYYTDDHYKSFKKIR